MVRYFVKQKPTHRAEKHEQQPHDYSHSLANTLDHQSVQHQAHNIKSSNDENTPYKNNTATTHSSEYIHQFHHKNHSQDDQQYQQHIQKRDQQNKTHHNMRPHTHQTKTTQIEHQSQQQKQRLSRDQKSNLFVPSNVLTASSAPFIPSQDHIHDNTPTQLEQSTLNQSKISNLNQGQNGNQWRDHSSSHQIPHHLQSNNQVQIQDKQPHHNQNANNHSENDDKDRGKGQLRSRGRGRGRIRGRGRAQGQGRARGRDNCQVHLTGDANSLKDQKRGKDKAKKNLNSKVHSQKSSHDNFRQKNRAMDHMNPDSDAYQTQYNENTDSTQVYEERIHDKSNETIDNDTHEFDEEFFWVKDDDITNEKRQKIKEKFQNIQKEENKESLAFSKKNQKQKKYDAYHILKKYQLEKFMTLFDSYSDANQMQKLDAEYQQLSKRKAMIIQLALENYECVICGDSISRNQETWNCQDCGNAFHLKCINKWAQENMLRALEREEQSTNGNHFMSKLDEDNQIVYWKCPHCISRLYTSIPEQYFCYCGRLRNPKLDHELVPHSCGHVCGRTRGSRQPNCPHTCQDLCHPGPCEICDMSTEIACHCGKHYFQIACNDDRYNRTRPSCGEICGKQLKCGIPGHTCQQTCHSGECQPCQRVEKQSCFCGKDIREKKCYDKLTKKTRQNSKFWQLQIEDPLTQQYLIEYDTEQNIYKTFACGNTCGKLLPCGMHYCERPCHLGKCISKIKTAWNVPNQSDNINVDRYIAKHGCHQQCKKPLPCGHPCTLKCHPSNPDACMTKCHQKIRLFCPCQRKCQIRQCNGILRPEEQKLECDEECRKIKRIRQIAKAFQIDFDKREIPNFSDDLIQFTRKNPHIVQNWEYIFDELLLSEEERPFYRFPPMKKEIRALIHELSNCYNIESYSIDPEPNRSIIVEKSSSSYRPLILLTEAVKDPQKLEKLRQKAHEEEQQEKYNQEKEMAQKQFERMRRKHLHIEKKRFVENGINQSDTTFSQENFQNDEEWWPAMNTSNRQRRKNQQQSSQEHSSSINQNVFEALKDI